jgi:uncharacterized protein YdhG (YjbR/CyaY superfamily)
MPKKSAPAKGFRGFTDEEKAAMRDHAKEMRGGVMDGEGAVLAKIRTMTGSDRVMAERFHALVRANAPALIPRTWYGMPAYSNEDGKVVCFFQDAKKFKTRYATLGFSDRASLDEGHMWPTTFALTELGAAEEAKIVALLKRATG